ncbi:AMP-dependent synthetase and ligase, partial [Pseudomonas syringae pv. actinidiae ICMP 18804]
MDRMNWLNLEHLLRDALPDRLLTQAPALDHAQ